MRFILNSFLLLVVAVGVAMACHWVLARGCKAVVDSVRPLADGEHGAFGYERAVYHTAEPAMQRVVATVLGAALIGWLAWLSGFALVGLIAVAVLVAAVVLDLRHWERVSASATALWVQRGVGNDVDRFALDDIRDLAVDEEDGRGLTLRNLMPGARNTVCRLRIRLADKRVVALPRTDAANGLAEVEAVANHVRLRKQQATDKQSLASSSP